eukprot:Gb_12555 [translate_table: standard]
MAMATAQPFRNNNKKIVSFFGLMLHFQEREMATGALRREGNGNKGYVRTLCKQGQLKEALHILYVTDQHVDSSTYASVFHGCVKHQALPEGKLIHAHLFQTGFLFQDMFLSNTLVNMYAKCGNLIDARRVFDQMPERDVVSWTVMIAAYSKHEHSEEALTLFNQMKQTNVQPNQFTFASILPACANTVALEQGMEVHEDINRSGFQSDLFVGNALVDMYAKCGSIENARYMFDIMPQRDVVSWSSMIAGYAQNGHLDEALKLFQEMSQPNVIPWTAMISGYAQYGHSEEAVEFFRRMQLAGVMPNSKTFASVLPACANLAALEQGKEIHEEMIRSGFESDVFVGNALIDMYAKCGSLENARCLFDNMHEQNIVSWTAMIAGYAQNGQLHEALKLFQKMPERNVVSWTAMTAGYAQNGYVDDALKLFQEMPEKNLASWNAMIAGYAQNGFGREALKFFQQMQLVGVKPNSKTFASVLPACANLEALEHGKEIHEEVIRRGFQSDVFVGNALVDMYAKCGSIENAYDLFHKMHQRDVVSWTAMITGYAHNGHVDEGLKLFQIMPKQNVASWTAMIAGYAQNGHSEEAMKLFQQMQVTGVKPNSNTFASVLPACANLAALEHGKEIHEEVIRSGFQSDVFVGSALVDMYAKCGSIENARNLFDKMPQRNVVSWTTLIQGYAMHGCGKEAIELFEQMQHFGVNPNPVTLVGVLSACCHAGLVDEGQQYFACMSEYYHITPTLEHYGCMVDLLGRAGRLDEAQDFINKMPIKPDASVWGSLMGACRIHNNIVLGERVAEHLFELDPTNASPYVSLSNIYASAGRWDDIEKVRKMMKEGRVKKKPGCSWIEVNNQLYGFVVGDRAHPQLQEIYSELENLSTQMKAEGHEPDTIFDLNDVEE